MTDSAKREVLEQAKKAKDASRSLRHLATSKKNEALCAMARSLLTNTKRILEANVHDLETLGSKNDAFRSRLILSEQKISAMARGINNIALLPDPVGDIMDIHRRPNGLKIGKMRVPIGVICCIYESRPNVTADIAALALKSGNACVLRGGKESLLSNIAIAEVLGEAAESAGINKHFIQMIITPDHNVVPELAKCDKYIDLIIPRGGEVLIDAVSTHAKMPVLRHRKGITHIYADGMADIDIAVKIIVNAKVSNPSACNSLEKALIDKSIAEAMVPMLVKALTEAGVETRGCERIQALVPSVVLATDEDWATEYLDLIITLKVVDGFDDAVAHINRYSTGLADGIVTRDHARAWAFMDAVDSAATFVNASTRFTDGSEFGLGAEVGINTSKIHGMGPMGLEALTVTKYIVFGDGHIRQ